jgi:hypothetical protein
LALLRQQDGTVLSMTACATGARLNGWTLLLMQDLKDRLEKMMADAADCELIGSLATDAAKRAMFRRLAEQFRAMAEELKAGIARREGA